ncbi:type 2 periplasmic-binding domain-containing protein [Dongshaea marina]|uniref:hypothetical protein n=1 Tax=Dongshaea marina TaxID=2047966 RepID=UPI000D3E2BE7|nr:hypothetical protein [Dongshaea marina]
MKDYQIGIARFSFFYRPDLEINWDGERFNGGKWRIISIPGTKAEEKLRRLKADASDIHIKQLEVALKLVERGRADGVIMEEHSGEKIVKAMNLENKIIKSEKPFIEEGLYLVFSKEFYDRHQSISRNIWSEVINQRYRITQPKE